MGRISSFAEDFFFIGVLPQTVTCLQFVACSDIVHDCYKSTTEECLASAVSGKDHVAIHVTK